LLLLLLPVPSILLLLLLPVPSILLLLLLLLLPVPSMPPTPPATRHPPTLSTMHALVPVPRMTPISVSWSS
jgi:hypothetical protein